MAQAVIPSRAIRVTTLFDRPASKLPVFHKNDLAWLLGEAITLEAKSNEKHDAVVVSLAITGQGVDEQTDVLVLAHASRVVLVQLLTADDEVAPCLVDDGQRHLGFETLSAFLLAAQGLASSCSESLLQGIVIRLTSLYASEIAYLLYNTFRMHSTLLDLDLLASKQGLEPSLLNPMTLGERLLGNDAATYWCLTPSQFRVIRGETNMDTSFLQHLMSSIRLATAGYYAAQKSIANISQSMSSVGEILQQCTLDTRIIREELLIELARFTAVETMLQLAKPKETIARLKLRRQATARDDARGSGSFIEIVPHAKEKYRFTVYNEQFKHRILRNTRQVLSVIFQDGDESREFTAKAIASKGKESRLQFIGSEADSAAQLLVDASSKAEVSSTRVISIVVHGREDHAAAELDGMYWRRDVLCKARRAVSHGPSSRNSIDKANLLFPLLFGKSFDVESASKHINEETIEIFEKPWRRGFTVIASRERLNESQSRAARAILSPLVERCAEDSKEQTGTALHPRDIADRLIIVHGPPGTGKTSLITAVCQQFTAACNTREDVLLNQSQTENEAVCEDHDYGEFNEDLVEKIKSLRFQADKSTVEAAARPRETIYACCQSNVAVKNIAESLSRSNIDFRIIVSPNFYVDWHEDLYVDIKARMIQSDALPTSRSALQHSLGNCDVILSTIAFLSHPRIVAGDKLLQLRPMRLLMVDEASQIHLRAYPHLFERFGSTVGRIIFLGDDCQLAPFQADEIPDAGVSVFEQEHLRKKAFLLDTCYRLPKPLVEFISENMYGGKVISGPCNEDPDAGLAGCVSFVDVQSSKETFQGTSRLNAREVEVIVALVQTYKDRGGDLTELKVLTTYDAQRDLLEKSLKEAGLSGSADTVFSVDSFQGRESNHIILSLVRDGRPAEKVMATKPNPRRAASRIVPPNLGFLKNERRSNVALTRCKSNLVIVSNRRFVIDVGGDTLVGRLQADMQWADDGDVAHWIEEADIVKGELPDHLYHFS